MDVPSCCVARAKITALTSTQIVPTCSCKNVGRFLWETFFVLFLGILQFLELQSNFGFLVPRSSSRGLISTPRRHWKPLILSSGYMSTGQDSSACEVSVSDPEVKKELAQDGIFVVNGFYLNASSALQLSSPGSFRMTNSE